MQEFKNIIQSCLDQQSKMFKKELLKITKRIDKLENHISKESKKIEKIHTILLKIERRKPTTKKPVQTKKTLPGILHYWAWVGRVEVVGRLRPPEVQDVVRSCPPSRARGPRSCAPLTGSIRIHLLSI